MDKHLFLICIIAIFLIIYYKQDNRVIEKMSLVEAFDRNKYLVRDLKDKEISADLLAKLMKNLKYLITVLKKRSETTTDQKLLEFKPFIETIYYKIDDVKVRENEGGNNLTSYSVNKGEELVFCLRSKQNDKIHDLNELMYVAIHEIGHIGCPETGHTKLFAQINLFLLKEAVKLGVYTYRDYSIEPVEYCGMTLTTNILG
jgi:hypothetical protein